MPSNETMSRDRLEAINILTENNLMVPVAILSYSTIDHMAWLDRSKTEELDTDDGKYFKRWVERYLLPNSKLQCSSDELWGSRCAIIHTNTPESRNINRRMIVFTNIEKGVEEMQRQYDASYQKNVEMGLAGNRPSPIVISFESLLGALWNSIDKFESVIENDPDKKSVVIERMDHYFVSKPKGARLNYKG